VLDDDEAMGDVGFSEIKTRSRDQKHDRDLRDVGRSNRL
jgi:hypothetical protein